MTTSAHSLVIIGSGPAGYAAATYAARAGLSPVLYAGEHVGGQLMYTTTVENYLGFAQGIMGPDLMEAMRSQAQVFGTQIRTDTVKAIDTSKRPFAITTSADQVHAESIVIATGAESRMLSIPGEREYLGRGVATCAVCDAPFYRDKNVMVVGGGDAAVEDVLALTKFARSITLLVRTDSLRASKIMQERLLAQKQVTIAWNTIATEVVGDGTRVTQVVVTNTTTKQTSRVETDGFFLAIGHDPATKFLLGSSVELDDKGYIVTRLGLSQKGVEQAASNMSQAGLVAFPTATSVEGIFAAGDCVDFRYRQAMTAAGLGVMAALDAQWWLERQGSV
jgi:thioredoxin reductase (NADPH)